MKEIVKVILQIDCLSTLKKEFRIKNRFKHVRRGEEGKRKTFLFKYCYDEEKYLFTSIQKEGKTMSSLFD